MLCLRESSDCLRDQMHYMMRSLQDLKHLRRTCPPARQPPPAPPQAAPLATPVSALTHRSAVARACHQRALQRERHARLRMSDASTASTYDSACCLASPLEEDEDEEEDAVSHLGLGFGSGRLGLGSPSSEKSLEFDSGYSEASWQDEALVLRRTRNVRVSSSACLRTNRAASGGRVRPKSTSDACLERWTSFEVGEPEDWTTSLLTRGRNRQPLVLGDNSFADLIQNWMDLPDFPEPAVEQQKPGSGRRIAKGFLVNVRRKLAGMSKSVEGRVRMRPTDRASRTANAPKRLSCPVGVQQHQAPRGPFFHQSHSGLNELDRGFYQFTALMKSGSRQPIICNDVIGYI